MLCLINLFIWTYYTGPLKRLFHYAIFQKFFVIFMHQWSKFYHTCNLILTPFYFYKSYQRLIRQQLYIHNKIQSNENRTTYLNPLYLASDTRFHICSFKHCVWLPMSFFILFQMLSMRFMSGEFPDYSRTWIPLHSRICLFV